MDRSVLAVLGTVLLSFAGVPAQFGQQGQEVFSEDWRWVEFGPESGIPSERIFDWIETSESVPWVATDRGLAWYDGTVWHRVSVEGWTGAWNSCDLEPDLLGGVLACDGKDLYRGDAAGLRRVDLETEVRQAVALSEDELLLASTDGLLRFDGTSLRSFPVPEGGRIAKEVTPIFRTREGYLWSRTMGGTFLWQDGRWLRLFKDWAGFVSLSETEGVLGGFGTPIAGLWTWSGPAGTTPQRIPGDGVPALRMMDAIPGGFGIACYISGRVRVRMEGKSWADLNEVPMQIANARFVRIQENGDLWAGGDEGLHLFRYVPRWHRMQFAGPEGSNQINDLLVTSAGDLWVATSAGVYIKRLDGEVESLQAILDQPLQTVTGLCEDADGGIWISSGLDFPGAYRFHEGAWQHYGEKEGLNAQLVHRIVRDRSGRTWFLGISKRVGEDEPGAFAFDGESFEPWGVKQGLLSGRVYDFVESENGDFWFATALGLSRFKMGKWIHWTKTSGLSKHRVFCLAEGSDNRVWFGHTDGVAGLGYVDERNRVSYLNKRDGLIGGNIKDLDFDSEGRLWIGSESGLGVYADGRFSRFQRPEGLSRPNLWPVLAREDYVIIGTVGEGVHCLTFAEAVNPPPGVQIRSMPHGSGARIEWATIAHRGALAPDRIETRYRLDAGDWSPWDRTRVTVLEDLASGPHQFTVQAKGLFGSIDPAGVSLEFRVPSPFYLHPAFILTVLLLGLGGMTGLWSSTKRRLYQRRLLERSEERHRTLVEQLPICIHELDLEGRVLSMNPAGLRMLELARESDIVGADYLALIAEEDRMRVKELFHQATRGVVTEFEFAAPIKGRVHKFETALEPLRGEDGSVVRLMGYSIDTTEREKAEEDRRLLETRLQEAKKMQAVAVLAGGVAHDFNNLLTIIGGHAAMINAGPGKSESVSKSSVEILKAQERAAGLTKQLLTLGRRQPPRPVIADLRDIVRGIEEMLLRLIGEQIEFTLELAPADCMVYADPGQMEQVLINLVVNARDAMPSGGKLEVACGPLSLESAETMGGTRVKGGDYVVLSVQDSGTGLDEETRSRIFEPFFTTKGLEKGTGLGLSTIHAVIEEHEGQVIVESEVGVGSCFSIFLPVSQETLTEIPRPTDMGRIKGGRETLLLVDDDPPIRQLVRDSLESMGYRVLSARDGVEALEIAERADHSIHLLLTDVIMPRMCGRALATAFAERFPQTKVIFMTGYADAPDWQPTAPVLAKPFKPEELAALVRTTLDRVEELPLA